MAKIKIYGAEPTHPDGVQITEAATDKLGFHGATPVVQATVAVAAGAAPTAAEFDAVVNALVAKGLLKL